MKNAKIFINNSIIDSEEAFGVFFTDASITALMTPSPLKEYHSIHYICCVALIESTMVYLFDINLKK